MDWLEFQYCGGKAYFEADPDSLALQIIILMCYIIMTPSKKLFISGFFS